MSDCDDFMGDDEEYDLEYSEESNSEPDVDLENQYYNSKALKEDDPKAALESFQRWGIGTCLQMSTTAYYRTSLATIGANLTYC